MLHVPVLREITQLIIAELERKSIVGLSVVTFLGSLFFIGYPGDLLYLIYIRAGYGIMYVSLIMLFWMVIAQAINYWCGLLIEKKFLDKFIKEQKKSFKSSIKKYDAVFIIVVNILPLPADILAVFLGMIRYDFKKAMLYTIIGRTLKFLLNAILMVLFKDISLAFFQ
jgi:undecaprenyl-diphosphatase